MLRRLSFSNVVSVVALFVALGGSAYAISELGRGDVKGRHIAPNAISSKHVGSNKLNGGDIKESSLAIPKAYARVSSNGSIARAKGIRQDDVTDLPSDGSYCFDVQARHAQATAGFRTDAPEPVDTIFILDNALADAAQPGGLPGVTDLGCAPGDDFFVGSGEPPSNAADTSFWIVFF